MPDALLSTLADLRPWPLAALARALACDESTIRAQLAELQTRGIVPLEDVPVCQTLEVELVNRIRRVRNQLAQKNLAVRIDRMDHQIQ